MLGPWTLGIHRRPHMLTKLRFLLKLLKMFLFDLFRFALRLEWIAAAT